MHRYSSRQHSDNLTARYNVKRSPCLVLWTFAYSEFSVFALCSLLEPLERPVRLRWDWTSFNIDTSGVDFNDLASKYTARCPAFSYLISFLPRSWPIYSFRHSGTARTAGDWQRDGEIWTCFIRCSAINFSCSYCLTYFLKYDNLNKYTR